MTYNPKKAEIEPRSKEEWLDIILEDGSDYWGDDITDREHTAIRHLYDPFAGRLADLEEKLRIVQLSHRLDEATHKELDYIGEDLGVDRRQASRASGSVVFSSDTSANKDYLIQSGEIVSTGGSNPIEFETVEDVTLSSGTSSVSCDIEAREAGSSGNVAAGSIKNIEASILGVDSVNNPNKTSAGRDREGDENYRERINTKLGNLKVTSLRSVYNDLTQYEFVRSVQAIDNAEDDNGNELGTHQSEIIVNAQSGHEDEIAQTIFDNIPMGVDLVNGINGEVKTGTASLPNGQTFTIKYSKPTETDIYVDVDLVVEESIDTNNVKSEIVEYIGGVKPNGELVNGDLGVKDNVIEGEIEYAARSVLGVYDVNHVYLDTSSSPSSSTNVSISSDNVAIIDHTNITVSTTTL